MSLRIDDYKKYWNEVVLPDYEDFMSDVGNLRKAFHLAISLFHMTDWLYWGNKEHIDANFTFLDKDANSQRVTSESTFSNSICDYDPDFELIRGIANASKHLKLQRPGQHAASPTNAANTYVTSTGYGVGSYSTGPYGGSPRVRLQGPNNQDIELTDLAGGIRDMWLRLCRERNIPL